MDCHYEDLNYTLGIFALVCDPMFTDRLRYGYVRILHRSGRLQCKPKTSSVDVKTSFELHRRTLGTKYLGGIHSKVG